LFKKNKKREGLREKEEDSSGRQESKFSSAIWRKKDASPKPSIKTEGRVRAAKEA